MEGKLAGVVIALLIGGGVFWMRTQDKNENKTELKAIAYMVLENAENYSKNQSDYEYYFDMFHDDVFEDHYRMGSKRVAPSFDEEGYWTVMFDSMITTARADGEDGVVEGLEQLQDEMF
jgi:hypothetical protein